MYSGASNFANGVDLAFYIILGISLVFLVGITATMIYFVIRYSKKRNPVPTDVKDNMTLEITWTVIPTLLVLVMFYFGWLGYYPMKTVPDNSIPIKATSRMWSWKFDYPNGKSANTLIVPIGKPILLDMISEDVIHGLFVPAFRIKEDIVPGKKNTMWFIAEKEGSFDIYCSQFCGMQHSYMMSKVEVKSVAEYTKWYNSADTTQASLEPIGLQIIKKNGCNACHSFDGNKTVGPSFKGAYGKTEEVEVNGTKKTITVDDAYIKRSIYEPNAEIVVGFNPVMPPYKDKLNDKEVEEVIKYMKELK